MTESKKYPSDGRASGDASDLVNYLKDYPAEKQPEIILDGIVEPGVVAALVTPRVMQSYIAVRQAEGGALFTLPATFGIEQINVAIRVYSQGLTKGQQIVDDAPADIQICDKCYYIFKAEPTNAQAAYAAIDAVSEERKRQVAQWGGAAHDDHHHAFEWVEFIDKQTDMAIRDSAGFMIGTKDHAEAIRARLVKIAALALAAIESIDRKAKRD